METFDVFTVSVINHAYKRSPEECYKECLKLVANGTAFQKAFASATIEYLIRKSDIEDDDVDRIDNKLSSMCYPIIYKPGDEPNDIYKSYNIWICNPLSG